MKEIYEFIGEKYLIEMDCQQRKGTGHSRGDYFDYDYDTLCIGGEGRVHYISNQVEPFIWSTRPLDARYQGICLDLNKHLIEIEWEDICGENAKRQTIDIIALDFIEQIKKSKEEQRGTFFPVPKVVPRPISYEDLFSRRLCYDRAGNMQFRL